MKDPKRQKAGKKARDHGADFERKCARLLPQLIDHLYWKRTRLGDKQYYGDLVPCDAPMLKGPERTDLMPDFHIECKFRAKGYTMKQVRGWMRAVNKTAHYTTKRWLLVGGMKGPVFAVFCDDAVDNEQMKDSALRCYMLGTTKERSDER